MVSNANQGQKPCGETLLWAKGDHTVGSCPARIGEKVKVKLLVTQSCLILCDPMDCSPPGFSVHGTLQARLLEWVATPFFRYLPNPGIGPGSPALWADSLLSQPPGKPPWLNPNEQETSVFVSLQSQAQNTCFLN